MESTAQPTKMLRFLAAIQERDSNDVPIIKNRFFTLKEDVANDYDTEMLPTIPKGTVICAEFGGDFGMYATADINGVLHRIKIELHELHKIDFGDFD